jgi:hypothetical protein
LDAAARYPDGMESADRRTLAEARAVYFAANALGDGGYGDPSIRVKFGPLVVDVPNTAARRRAVPLHDLHHALTGYGSDWRGECAISGWEIAGGCGRYGAAWVLVLGGFGLGVLVYPLVTLRAFARGRGGRNLFTDYPDGASEALFAISVADMRARLGIDRPPRALGPMDLLAFLGWVLIAVPLAILMFLATLPLAVVQWPRRALRAKV